MPIAENCYQTLLGNHLQARAAAAGTGRGGIDGGVFGGEADGGNGVVEVGRKGEVAGDEVESADQRLGVVYRRGLQGRLLGLPLQLSHGTAVAGASLW